MRDIRQLGSAVLVYMIGIILLITLAPYRFELPVGSQFLFSWMASPFDILVNIFLFVPVGFLFQLSFKKGPQQTLLFGLLLSLGIETLQLMLPGRYTTISDIVANSAGCLMGSLTFRLLRFRLRKLVPGIITFELPLMSNVYLITPLLWLSSLATWKELDRLWLLLIPAGMVTLVFAALFHKRLGLHRKRHYIMAALISMCWFAVAVFPVLVIFPLRVFVFSLFVGAVQLLVLRLIKRNPGTERRFERPTVRQILPWFALYLLLLNFWPLKWAGWYWDWHIGLPRFQDNPPLAVIFRLVEYLAAMSLLGYMIAEYWGRRTDYTRRASLFVLMVMLLLETLHGVPAGFGVSALRMMLAMAFGLAGIQIYTLQLRAITFLLQYRSPQETTALPEDRAGKAAFPEPGWLRELTAPSARAELFH